MSRTEKIICMTGVTTFIIIPIECIRAISICASIIPLLAFSVGEYIFTDEQLVTEKIAYILEFGCKDQVEKLAKEAGFECRIY